MADEVQALLERINDEGLKKADQERERLLGEAREEAKRLVADAKSEADRLRTAAEQEAELTREKGRQSLQQASRDVLLSLRKQLEERLRGVCSACVSEALSAERLGEIIAGAVRAYMEQGGKVDQLKVLIPAEQASALEGSVMSALGADLKANTELVPVAGTAAGFRLNFNGEDMAYDFSDEALAEALCVFLSPRLAELVTSAADQVTDQA
jgi:V/A-type H+-transporting ATPase subunit E